MQRVLLIRKFQCSATALSQLDCHGKTLKGYAIESAHGNNSFVAQVTVYARTIGITLAHKAYDTHESSWRAAIKDLLSSIDLEGKLI